MLSPLLQTLRTLLQTLLQVVRYQCDFRDRSIHLGQLATYMRRKESERPCPALCQIAGVLTQQPWRSWGAPMADTSAHHQIPGPQAQSCQPSHQQLRPDPEEICCRPLRGYVQRVGVKAKHTFCSGRALQLLSLFVYGILLRIAGTMVLGWLRHKWESMYV